MRGWGLQRGVRGCVRGPGGGIGVVVIAGSGGRGVLSSARRRWDVGRGGSRVREAASPRGVRRLPTTHPNLQQSRFPGRRRAVWRPWSGSEPVSGGYEVQCLSGHSSPRHMDTRAGVAVVGPAIARHISIWVSASLRTRRSRRTQRRGARRSRRQQQLGARVGSSRRGCDCQRISAKPAGARARPTTSLSDGDGDGSNNPSRPHIHSHDTHHGRRRKDPVRLNACH